MLISTKGRYALRVMTELASCPEGEYLSLRVISEKQNISEKYLEAIVSRLLKASLVEGIRGKNGGYRLAVPASECTIGSIIKAAEGSISAVECTGIKGDSDEQICSRADICLSLPMWKKLNTLIDDYFESITLSQMIEESKASL